MSNDTYRVVFLGASEVGKTSLIVKMTGNTFDSYLENTVACDFKKFSYDHNGTEINLSLWDTAGQEQYRSITNYYFKGAKFFMLVCSIEDLNTLNELDYFIELINSYADTNNFKTFILCNKVDLEETQKKISIDDINVYQKKMNIDEFFFTSAKSGEGIPDVLDAIAKLILQNDDISDHHTIDLKKTVTDDGKKKNWWC